MEDEPRESTFFINWHPWQPTALIIGATLIIVCLLLSTLLSRVDALAAAELKAQLSCMEAKVNDR